MESTECSLNENTMAFPYKTLRLTKENSGIYRLVLNRPEVKNALNRTMLAEMTEAVMDVQEDEATRALVIDHEGDTFCAGADLSDLSKLESREEALQYARLLFDLLDLTEKSPFPVIVTAHGNIYGGGIGLLAAADITFLTENCRLCFSEVKIGMVPAVISAFVLKKISSGSARELMLSAREFKANEALEYGLASFVLPADQLQQQVNLYLQTLVANKQKALAECKKMIFTASRITWLGAARDFTTGVFADMLLNQDARESIKSFLSAKKMKGQNKKQKNNPR